MTFPRSGPMVRKHSVQSPRNQLSHEFGNNAPDGKSGALFVVGTRPGSACGFDFHPALAASTGDFAKQFSRPRVTFTFPINQYSQTAVQNEICQDRGSAPCRAMTCGERVSTLTQPAVSRPSSSAPRASNREFHDVHTTAHHLPHTHPASDPDGPPFLSISVRPGTALKDSFQACQGLAWGSRSVNSRGDKTGLD